MADPIHESHNVIHSVDDWTIDRFYCLECEEWSLFVLSQPCRGGRHTGNIVLPQHVPEAIIRGSQ